MSLLMAAQKNRDAAPDLTLPDPFADKGVCAGIPR
jgi:hypothetical protein